VLPVIGAGYRTWMLGSAAPAAQQQQQDKHEKLVHWHFEGSNQDENSSHST
jgi:hypothetical protein